MFGLNDVSSGDGPLYTTAFSPGFKMMGTCGPAFFSCGYIVPCGIIALFPVATLHICQPVIVTGAGALRERLMVILSLPGADEYSLFTFPLSLMYRVYADPCAVFCGEPVLFCDPPLFGYVGYGWYVIPPLLVVVPFESSPPGTGLYTSPLRLSTVAMAAIMTMMAIKIVGFPFIPLETGRGQKTVTLDCYIDKNHTLYYILYYVH